MTVARRTAISTLRVGKTVRLFSSSAVLALISLNKMNTSHNNDDVDKFVSKLVTNCYLSNDQLFIYNYSPFIIYFPT